MFNNKGQVRIIEAFLSVGVMFAVLLATVTFPSSPDLSQSKNLASLGTQAMVSLDVNGSLGNMISHREWTSIKGSLAVLLPVDVAFNLTVYDEGAQPLNNQVIQNANLLGSDVVSVRYICAGGQAEVAFYVLRLQLSKVT